MKIRVKRCITHTKKVVLRGFLLFTSCLWAQNSYYFNFNTNNGLPSAQCYHTFEDSKGYLWFTTDRGISKYDSNAFVNYSTENGLANQVNFKFYADPTHKDAFWVNGFDGSFSYWNGEAFTPFAFNSKLIELKTKGSWFQIFNIKNEHLYFFEIFAQNTVKCPEKYYTIDINTGNIESFVFDEATEMGAHLSSEVLYAIENCGHENTSKLIIHTLTDRKGNYWKLTRKGAFFYEKGNVSQPPKLYFENIPISSLYEDDKGSYWFTSLNNGIFYLPSLNVSKLNLGAFSDAFCNSIKVYKDHLILKFIEQEQSIIITPDKSIHKFNLNKRKYYDEINEKLNLDISNQREREPFAYNHFKINDQYVLIKTGSYFSLKRYEHEKIVSNIPYNIKTIDFLNHSDGTIWIGAVDGLYKIDFNTNLDLVKVHFPNEEILTRVNGITETSKGIWIATMTKGLFFRANAENSSYNIPTLKNQSIQTLFQENDTTLWVGTNKRLHKINYTFNNGKPRIETTENFTINDGLPSNFINDITLWNDRLYVATDKGIGYFKPSEFSKKQQQPKFMIDDIVINGKSMGSQLATTELQHNQNTISIHYTGITHHKPTAPDYFYRYQVNDADWNYTNSRSIDFNALSQGSYNIVFQCQNNAGIWSEPAQVEFTIQPHFTSHWLFISSIFLGIGMLVTKLVRMRILDIRKRAKQNLAFKEAQLATLRSQMNPHFVFNSLNTLQDYIFEGNPITANDYISDFARLMRKSLEFSKLDSISLTDEIAFITNYLSLEQRRFDYKFEFEIQQQIPKEEIVHIPPLMVQPLVENAVKHAFKKNNNATPKITVTYQSYDKDTVLVHIMDNGDGFNYQKSEHKKDAHTSLGIDIIQQRLQLINTKKKVTTGNLSYLNTEKGTHAQLLLPKYQHL